jgi:hypothetical protein
MQISPDTQKVLDFLLEYSKGNLRKPNDIATILEISATYDLADEINDLAFYGKSLWNMHKTIKRNETNPDGIANIIKEIENTRYKIIQLLDTIISLANEDIKARFNNNYFLSTAGNYLNIIDLAHDFALFKNLQIDVQQKQS